MHLSEGSVKCRKRFRESGAANESISFWNHSQLVSKKSGKLISRERRRADAKSEERERNNATPRRENRIPQQRNV